MKRDSLARKLPFTILGVLFLAVMIFPVYWMVNASLQANGSAVSSSPYPTRVDTSGYQAAFSQQLGNLGTSLIVAVGSVLLTLVVAAPAAYALARFGLRGKGIVLLALLIAQMIPGIVIANALYTAFNDLRLLDSYLGLILADASLGIPFAVLIMRAFMQGIPASLVEAARVDGASQFRAFWSIVVPISRNSIITAALFTFLFTWSDFTFALTLTTSDKVRPVTLGIYQYLSGNVQNWGPVMATAVLASIPAIVLLIVAQRYIAAGALGGALK
jgi:multiple sugar transport system permease protein